MNVKTVPKPWGHELIFAHTPQYVGKMLFVREGQALSLQYHRVKDETIHVQTGRLRLQVGARGAALSEDAGTPLEDLDLEPGRSFHVPPLTRHRFIAQADTTLLEVSTPELDDVVRLEDRYGRAGTDKP